MLILLLSLAAGAAAPGPRIEVEVVWRTPADAGVGSPRTADLDGDGTQDVVVGAGVEDRRGAALALDGRTGRPLWRQEFPDEVLTTSPVPDITGDGIAEILVAGRKRLHDVLALSGKDGRPVWSLTRANPDVEFPRINFASVLPVEDRDADGTPELLVVQAGGRDQLRYAARYHWVRARDGRLVATRVAPDGKESYALPLFEPRPDGRHRFYLATGGDTIGGNLIKLALGAWKEEWRIREPGVGFIGSPLVADLEGDGRDEVVAVSHGSVFRVDAESGRIGWHWRDRPYWTYGSPAVGRYDGDDTLDVVVGFNRGVWPRRDETRLLWLAGATGKPISDLRIEQAQRHPTSSPLVLDVDLDGRDETLFVLSNPLPDRDVPDQTHRLVILDGSPERNEVFGLELPGYSLATPRLIDLDGDGRLDVLHATQHEVLRIELTVTGTPGDTPRLPAVRWGEFRGPQASGIYRSR
jgi:outer membrane protein assembly factor BamB